MQPAISEQQHKVVQKVTKQLFKKFSNLPQVDVEEAVAKATDYVTKKHKHCGKNFRRSLFWKASNLLATTHNNNKTLYSNLQELQATQDDNVAPPADVLLEREEFYDIVVDRICKLSVVEQNVLYLYLGGHTIASTAMLLKTGRGRTTTIRETVFKKLREGLEDYEIY